MGLAGQTIDGWELSSMKNTLLESVTKGQLSLSGISLSTACHSMVPCMACCSINETFLLFYPNHHLIHSLVHVCVCGGGMGQMP